MSSGLNSEIELPEGVTASVTNDVVTLKGEKGEVTRPFVTDALTIKAEGNKIVLTSRRSSKNEKKTLGSIRAHIRNMVVGVTEGHHYKMKILSGHFPMTVTANGNEFMVKNFIGEKTPRTFKIPEGVTIKINGQDIDIDSCNKELAGATMTKIEQLTKRVEFDRRIFQDGIVLVK